MASDISDDSTGAFSPSYQQGRSIQKGGRRMESDILPSDYGEGEDMLDGPESSRRPRSASTRSTSSKLREFPRLPSLLLESKSMSTLQAPLKDWQKLLLRKDEELKNRATPSPYVLPDRRVAGKAHLFDLPMDQGRKSKFTPCTPPFQSPGMHANALARKQEEEALIAIKRAKELLIEDLLTLEDLRILRNRFYGAFSSKGLDLKLFKKIIFDELGMDARRDVQIESLFMKIDSSCDGYIDWREFCHYMAVEMQEKEESRARQSSILPDLPALLGEARHCDTIMRIVAPRANTFISMAGDGSLCFWDITGGNLKLTRYRDPFKKLRPKVKVMGITKSMAERRGKTMEKKPLWVIDMAYLPTFNKFIMVTASREVCFFDGTTTELHARLIGFDSVAIRIHTNITSTGECTLVYGDRNGCVSVLVFKKLPAALIAWRKSPKLGAAPTSVAMETAIAEGHLKYSRWKVHNDWVEEARYIPKYDKVISVSCDKEKSIVMARLEPSTQLTDLLQDTERGKGKLRDAEDGPMKTPKIYTLKHHGPHDRAVFKVRKGVQTFDFSDKLSLLVSGGLDHNLRLWDPHVPHKPTCIFKGHSSPIKYIHIDDIENRIVSMSSDMLFKIWDIKNSLCVLTVVGKAHQLPGEFQAASYHDFNRCLAFAGDQFGIVPLGGRGFSPLLNTSHKDPVKCVRFNEKFNQVITMCEASMIRVWDVNSGTKHFEFSTAQEDHFITDMSLDTSGRRLLTSGRDGLVKLWNYNNGQCLIRLTGHGHDETVKKHESKREITALMVASLQANYYVVSGGWNHHITVHADVDSDESSVEPYPMWPADRDGQSHTEEITSLAFGFPDLLASGGFDGVICVWNIITGQLVAKHSIGDVLSLKKAGRMADRACGNLAVTSMAYLDRRHAPEADYDTTPHASLVSCGVGGNVLFWHYRRGFWDAFAAPRRHGVVHRIAVPTNNQFLVTGSTNGYVAVWDISEFGLTTENERLPREDPPLLSEWQAHTKKINSVELIEAKSMLLTASDDHCVRLWTLRGHFVGAFGQEQLWVLDDPTTFRYPLVPKDVLTDPVSIPKCMSSLGDFPKQRSAQSRTSHVTFREDEEEDFTYQSSRGTDSDIGPSTGSNSPASKAPSSSASSSRESRQVNYDFPGSVQGSASGKKPAAATMSSAPSVQAASGHGSVTREGTTTPSDTLDSLTSLLQEARAQRRGHPCPAHVRSLEPTLPVRSYGTGTERGTYAAGSKQDEVDRWTKSASLALPVTQAAPEPEPHGRKAARATSPINDRDIKVLSQFLSNEKSELKKEITDLVVKDFADTQSGRGQGRHFKMASDKEKFAPVVRETYDVGKFNLSGPSFPGRRLRHQLYQESKPATTGLSTTFGQLQLAEMKPVEMPQAAKTSFITGMGGGGIARKSPIKLGFDDFEKELKRSDERRDRRARRWKVADRKSSQTKAPAGTSKNERVRK